MEKVNAWMGIVAGVLLAASVSVQSAQVDINNADASIMASEIGGLGIRRAEAIVQYRKQHGPFKSVDELTNVPGISQRVINNNRGNLTVGIPVSKSSSN